eukprot:TRINITY_DN3823_c0_g1_i3.p1 TRINITY_DN3823_c0_g1~~TRINITY_DN3823_c0_g1_i3.p1  ORF type:complete len:426 (-),score=68.36 TRINITY_DN3823_c0_g1_i3:85-1362(-)
MSPIALVLAVLSLVAVAVTSQRALPSCLHAAWTGLTKSAIPAWPFANTMDAACQPPLRVFLQAGITATADCAQMHPSSRRVAVRASWLAVAIELLYHIFMQTLSHFTVVLASAFRPIELYVSLVFQISSLVLTCQAVLQFCRHTIHSERLIVRMNLFTQCVFCVVAMLAMVWTEHYFEAAVTVLWSTASVIMSVVYEWTRQFWLLDWVLQRVCMFSVRWLLPAACWCSGLLQLWPKIGQRRSPIHSTASVLFMVLSPYHFWHNLPLPAGLRICGAFSLMYLQWRLRLFRVRAEVILAAAVLLVQSWLPLEVVLDPITLLCFGVPSVVLFGLLLLRLGMLYSLDMWFFWSPNIAGTAFWSAVPHAPHRKSVLTQLAVVVATCCCGVLPPLVVIVPCALQRILNKPLVQAQSLHATRRLLLRRGGEQ